jgi:hypothetical protein
VLLDSIELTAKKISREIRGRSGSGREAPDAELDEERRQSGLDGKD